MILLPLLIYLSLMYLQLDSIRGHLKDIKYQLKKLNENNSQLERGRYEKTPI